MQRSCWLIRAGEENRNVGDFATSSAVAVGWNGVAGLADLTGVDARALRKILGGSAQVKLPTKDTAELLMFRDEMAVGDAVVTPDPANDDVLVGEILGEYEYRATPVGDCHHVRTVRWYGRQTRSDLPMALKKATDYRRTIKRLEPDADWSAVAERAEAGQVRTIDQLAKPRAKTSVGGSRAKPEPPPGIVCDHCGRQKAKSQYIAGSAYCVDCRTDLGD